MENSEDLAKVYSLIGVYSRILYDIEDSKKYLTSAIKINEQLEYHKYLFVNKLRLAHTFQWGESFDTSNSLFKELIRLTENNEEYNDYLDFLFQHYGKNLFDQKEYQRALNYFERALQIRMEKGNKELIHSTQHAINICIKEQS